MASPVAKNEEGFGDLADMSNLDVNAKFWGQRVFTDMKSQKDAHSDNILCVTPGSGWLRCGCETAIPTLDIGCPRECAGILR